ncbi:isochorismatase family protein [Xylanimonas protaetiae]|uniref:isochorismatase n=1 Tax=Xylanimonas protaetiae TaxID=2509457 RepID=A0A4P6FAF8_9MICO|nr:isochorismatase family protein [Xylanimonas protaetiae]QAY71269.1 isochorismatase family protein [Xylanimonas protaetiae]
MAIPSGIDYAAPLGDLPRSRAPWALEPARTAVLVHDLQRYFLEPFAPGCPALVGALDAAARIVAAAREAGVPVVYTAQTGDQDGARRGLQGDLWGPGMRAVAEHVGIVEQVAPAPGDIVLAKHRYSAFALSPLAEHLAAAGRDQLVIVGVYAHIGVTATALDAFQREVRPFVVADGVADFDAARHRLALEHVASCSGVVTLAADVVAALARTAPTTAPATVEPGAAWDAVVREALASLLPAAGVDAAFADADADLFLLGLNSLQAFDLLDVLADSGVDVDFAAFTQRATVAFLREQGRLLAH